MNRQSNISNLSQMSVVRQPGSSPMYDFSRQNSIEASETMQDDIARRAHEIYVQKGCPQGQCEQIWKQAEREQWYKGVAALRAKLRRDGSPALNSA